LPERDDIARECALVIQADVPSAPQDFAVTFERLAVHYPESKLSSGEQAVLKRDWLRLLGHYPADIFAGACDAYLLSPARFFPTPGQIKEIADPAAKYRSLLATRARDTLAAMTESNSQ
jgi:hypothetical protein